MFLPQHPRVSASKQIHFKIKPRTVLLPDCPLADHHTLSCQKALVDPTQKLGDFNKNNDKVMTCGDDNRVKIWAFDSTTGSIGSSPIVNI